MGSRSRSAVNWKDDGFGYPIQLRRIRLEISAAQDNVTDVQTVVKFRKVDRRFKFEVSRSTFGIESLTFSTISQPAQQTESSSQQHVFQTRSLPVLVM